MLHFYVFSSFGLFHERCDLAIYLVFSEVNLGFNTRLTVITKSNAATECLWEDVSYIKYNNNVIEIYLKLHHCLHTLLFSDRTDNYTKRTLANFFSITDKWTIFELSNWLDSYILIFYIICIVHVTNVCPTSKNWTVYMLLTFL